MNDRFDCLVDSDAFIGYFVEHDAHFNHAHTAFRTFSASQQILVTTNAVITETASMLSRRISQSIACRFVDFISGGDFPIIYLDKALQDAAHAIFLSQTNEGTSMVDCTNVAVSQYYNIPTIFGFDHFYTKFGLALIGS